MQILPVDDLDTALHDFVRKDDNMAFNSCFQKSIDEAKNKLTAATGDFNIEDKEEIVLELDQCMPAQVKGRTQTTASSQVLSTSTLSAFGERKCSPGQEKDTHAESDELVETSDGECPRVAWQKRPAPGGESSVSSSSRRRKTDLASFRRIPAAKEEDDGAANKDQPQVAGRYGAIRRR